MKELPPPKLSIGQWVRVILNERNKTPRTGRIHYAAWHFKAETYHYFITVNGKPVSKRYLEEDFELLPPEEFGPL